MRSQWRDNGDNEKPRNESGEVDVGCHKDKIRSEHVRGSVKWHQ